MKKLLGRKRSHKTKTKYQNKNNYHKKLQLELAKQPPTDNLIINLSDRQLTPDQHQILNRGLKFIPTPQPNNVQTCIQSFMEFKEE